MHDLIDQPENIVPDTSAFLRAIENIGQRFDSGLERVHNRIDEVGDEVSEMKSSTNVYAERLTNHIGTESIHQPVPEESCKTCKEHIANHSTTVKKDIGGIVGAAIIAAILLSGSAYIASKVFGG